MKTITKKIARMRSKKKHPFAKPRHTGWTKFRAEQLRVAASGERRSQQQCFGEPLRDELSRSWSGLSAAERRAYRNIARAANQEVSESQAIVPLGTEQSSVASPMPTPWWMGTRDEPISPKVILEAKAAGIDRGTAINMMKISHEPARELPLRQKEMLHAAKHHPRQCCELGLCHTEWSLDLPAIKVLHLKFQKFVERSIPSFKLKCAASSAEVGLESWKRLAGLLGSGIWNAPPFPAVRGLEPRPPATWSRPVRLRLSQAFVAGRKLESCWMLEFTVGGLLFRHSS
eukprot:5658025-Pyramimonas_sp.AAC.1